MFGYVRPLKSRLAAEDAERYQALYCGLCHTLQERYGRIASFSLHYDFAFLAMVLAGERQDADTHLRRCVIYPMRKRESWQSNPALQLAADESVILSYWKLRDGLSDHKLIKKLPHGLGALGLSRAYQKAKKRAPSFDTAVRQCLLELRALEEENCARLDAPADAFARILQAASGAQGEPGTHALGQMLYHIGRWIYLIDAWDDLREDQKNGTYNPILAAYGPAAQENREQLRETLYTSLGMVGEAADWLEFGPWKPIVENIIALGLPAIQEAVLSGEWKQAKQKRSNADE